MDYEEIYDQNPQWSKDSSWGYNITDAINFKRVQR